MDRRTDVWSFGCVLFECLTGRMAFTGESVPDVIARILESEPDWHALPPATPPRVNELLRRCLTRDPKHRFRDIGEARVALEDELAGTSGIVTAAGAAPAAPGAIARRARERLWPALAMLGLAAAATMAVMLVRSSRPAVTRPPALRAVIPLPPGLHLDGFGAPEVALSRDGRTLAFLARGATGPQKLYVRRLDDAEATLVPGSETAEGPFFSPDGRWVAFAVGTSGLGGSPPELRKHSLETGLTQTICGLADYFGGVWAEDDAILFVNAQPEGLWTVPASGGEPRPLAPRFRVDGRDAQKLVAWPDLLPGGRAVLLTDWDASHMGALIAVDLASREVKALGLAGSGGRLLPTGHLVYAGPDASLMAAPFDARVLRATGSPVALLKDVAIARNNLPVFAFSDDGTFVHATGYLRGSRREPMRLVRATRSGVSTPLPFEPDLFARGLVLSPDGARLAIATWDASRWVFDLRRGTRVKLPAGGMTEIISLAWAPDGRRLAVAGARAGAVGHGVYVQSADGTGPVETVVEASPGECDVVGWTPEGRTLVYWHHDVAGGTATLMRLDAGGQPSLVWKEAGQASGGALSPDRRFVAFESDSSGDFQVYAVPLSGEGGRVAVTGAAGRGFPAWSPDGRELYFRRDRKVMAVTVETTASGLGFGPERTLFEWSAGRGFAVGPQGEFYGTEPVPGAAEQTSLHLQTGWFAQVERLAGAGGRR